MAVDTGLLLVAIANTTFVCALLLLGIYQFREPLEAKKNKLPIYLAWVLVLAVTCSIELVVYYAIMNGTELINGIFLVIGFFGLVSFTNYYRRNNDT